MKNQLNKRFLIDFMQGKWLSQGEIKFIYKYNDSHEYKRKFLSSESALKYSKSIKHVYENYRK